MMQQPGMVPPPMAPPPAIDQQHFQQQQPQQYGQQTPQQQQPWMMAPPQLPQQQQMWGQQPQQSPAGSGQTVSPDEARTLWIGDLQPWMDEMYVRGCFPHINEVVNVKVIRNKLTLQSERYGFIEFVNHAAAERILQTYNGTMMPNVEQAFRLNWASHGGVEKRQDNTPDYTIFVGDLASDVTDYMLQETFKAHYHSVKGAKVVMDRLTGRSKGYGFVRFSEEAEQTRAMTEMNGYMLSNRAMRTGPAANKKSTGGSDSYPNPQGGQSDNDPNNTTIFVGNLDSSVTDEHLRQVFSPYGSLVHVKIPVGKRCGFVQFVDRNCAEAALQALNGIQLGGQNVRLSWGRSPSNRQDSNAGVAQPQWGAAGYYGYPQGYDAYGYGAGAGAAQDPSMYYGGYPAYGNYGVPQQQQPVQQQ